LGENVIASVLNLFVLRCKNVDASRRFYAALGIQFVAERHGNGPEHFAGKAGNTVFEIYPADERGVSNVRLGFSVASLQPIISVAVACGGRLVSEPKSTPWGVRAVVEDPDGNRVELSVIAQQAVAADRPNAGCG
jgi:lactoylglutathione lyase